MGSVLLRQGSEDGFKGAGFHGKVHDHPVGLLDGVVDRFPAVLAFFEGEGEGAAVLFGLVRDHPGNAGDFLDEGCGVGRGGALEVHFQAGAGAVSACADLVGGAVGNDLSLVDNGDAVAGGLGFA